MLDLGTVAGLIKALAPKADPAVIEQAVSDWLDDHPEIEVADGSITEEKLAADVVLTLSTLESDVSDVKTAIQGKLPITELTPIDTSMRGVLMDDGTIDNSFTNIVIKRYGACGKVYLNGTSSFGVGEHYCYLWIVKNGTMIGNVIPTSNPQTFSDYEITVPADADEIWVNPNSMTLKGFNSYDLSARKSIEEIRDQGIINLFNIHEYTESKKITNSGSIETNSGLFVTGYIPIEYGEFYSCNIWNSYQGYYNLYDENKNRIATHINNIGQPIYIGEQGAEFIRLDCVTSQRDNYVFCKGKIIPQRIKYPYNTKSIGSLDVISKNYALEKIGDIVHEMRSVHNLLDINSADIIDNKYIENYDSNGNPQYESSNSFFESGFIPIKTGDYYIIYNANTKTISTGLTHVYCDANKNGIYNSGGNHYSNSYGCCYCDKPGTEYMRIPVSKANKNYLMVIRLDPHIDQIPYEIIPYGYIPYGVKVNITDLYSQKATKTELIEAVNTLEAEIGGIVPSGTQWNGKSWYGYGTSITNTSAEGKYPTYLAQISGLVYTNKGISGGGIGDLGAYSHGQVYSAICNTTDGKLNADLITLETGANDCNSDVPLGTIYDTGTSTLAGCLNDCIRYLQKNTNAQICIINSPATTTEPTATNKYYEWADMVRRICDINRVHFLNNNNNMGYAKLSDSTKGSLYVSDNIHQTNLGGYIMAQNLWYQLRNIPLFYTTMPS